MLWCILFQEGETAAQAVAHSLAGKLAALQDAGPARPARPASLGRSMLTREVATITGQYHTIIPYVRIICLAFALSTANGIPIVVTSPIFIKNPACN